MTDDDKQWFLEQLKVLTTISDRVMSVEQRDAYWHALKDLSRSEMTRAFKHINDTWMWPRNPHPSDFRRAAKVVGWT